MGRTKSRLRSRRELPSFPLVDRVNCQYGATFARQRRGNFHISGIRLAFFGMTGKKQYRRNFAVPLFRQIKIGCDSKVLSALEQNLLHHKFRKTLHSNYTGGESAFL